MPHKRTRHKQPATPPEQNAEHGKQINLGEARVVEVVEQAVSATVESLPQSQIVDPESQVVEPQESMWQWLWGKTPFGAASQLSVMASFAIAPFHAITGAFANNSAVLCTIMYFFRKNQEVREQNTVLRAEIKKLRIYMEKELGIDHERVSRTNPPDIWWKSLGTFELQKDRMLYLLLSAIGLDIANCISTCIQLNSTNPTCTSNNQPDLLSSSLSDTLNSDVNLTNLCTLIHSELSAIGKIILSVTGTAAIGFALPQILAAHNLRQYQNELNKELKELQKLALESLEKQVESLGKETEGKNKIITSLGQETTELTAYISKLETSLLPGFQQIILELKRDISAQEASSTQLRSRIAKRIVDLNLTIESQRMELAELRLLKPIIKEQEETIESFTRLTFLAQSELERTISSKDSDIAKLSSRIRELELELTEFRRQIKQIQAAKTPTEKQEPQLKALSQAALAGKEWEKRSEPTQTLPILHDLSPIIRK